MSTILTPAPLKITLPHRADPAQNKSTRLYSPAAVPVSKYAKYSVLHVFYLALLFSFSLYVCGSMLNTQQRLKKKPSRMSAAWSRQGARQASARSHDFSAKSIPRTVGCGAV